MWLNLCFLLVFSLVETKHQNFERSVMENNMFLKSLKNPGLQYMAHFSRKHKRTPKSMKLLRAGENNPLRVQNVDDSIVWKQRTTTTRSIPLDKMFEFISNDYLKDYVTYPSNLRENVMNTKTVNARDIGHVISADNVKPEPSKILTYALKSDVSVGTGSSTSTFKPQYNITTPKVLEKSIKGFTETVNLDSIDSVEFEKRNELLKEINNDYKYINNKLTDHLKFLKNNNKLLKANYKIFYNKYATQEDSENIFGEDDGAFEDKYEQVNYSNENLTDSEKYLEQTEGKIMDSYKKTHKNDKVFIENGTYLNQRENTLDQTDKNLNKSNKKYYTRTEENKYVFANAKEVHLLQNENKQLINNITSTEFTDINRVTGVVISPEKIKDITKNLYKAVKFVVPKTEFNNVDTFFLAFPTLYKKNNTNLIRNDHFNYLSEMKYSGAQPTIVEREKRKKLTKLILKGAIPDSLGVKIKKLSKKISELNHKHNIFGEQLRFLPYSRAKRMLKQRHIENKVLSNRQISNTMKINLKSRKLGEKTIPLHAVPYKLFELRNKSRHARSTFFTKINRNPNTFNIVVRPTKKENRLGHVSVHISRKFVPSENVADSLKKYYNIGPTPQPEDNFTSIVNSFKRDDGFDTHQSKTDIAEMERYIDTYLGLKSLLLGSIIRNDKFHKSSSSDNSDLFSNSRRKGKESEKLNLVSNSKINNADNNETQPINDLNKHLLPIFPELRRVARSINYSNTTTEHASTKLKYSQNQRRYENLLKKHYFLPPHIDLKTYLPSTKNEIQVKSKRGSSIQGKVLINKIKKAKMQHINRSDSKSRYPSFKPRETNKRAIELNSLFRIEKSNGLHDKPQVMIDSPASQSKSYLSLVKKIMDNAKNTTIHDNAQIFNVQREEPKSSMQVEKPLINFKLGGSKKRIRHVEINSHLYHLRPKTFIKPHEYFIKRYFSHAKEMANTTKTMNTNSSHNSFLNSGEQKANHEVNTTEATQKDNLTEVTVKANITAATQDAETTAVTRQMIEIKNSKKRELQFNSLFEEPSFYLNEERNREELLNVDTGGVNQAGVFEQLEVTDENDSEVYPPTLNYTHINIDKHVTTIPKHIDIDSPYRTGNDFKDTFWTNLKPSGTLVSPKKVTHLKDRNLERNKTSEKTNANSDQNVYGYENLSTARKLYADLDPVNSENFEITHFEKEHGGVNFNRAISLTHLHPQVDDYNDESLRDTNLDSNRIGVDYINYNYLGPGMDFPDYSNKYDKYADFIAPEEIKANDIFSNLKFDLPVMQRNGLNSNLPHRVNIKRDDHEEVHKSMTKTEKIHERFTTNNVEISEKITREILNKNISKPAHVVNKYSGMKESKKKQSKYDEFHGPNEIKKAIKNITLQRPKVYLHKEITTPRSLQDFVKAMNVFVNKMKPSKKKNIPHSTRHLLTLWSKNHELSKQNSIVSRLSILDMWQHKRFHHPKMRTGNELIPVEEEFDRKKREAVSRPRLLCCVVRRPDQQELETHVNATWGRRCGVIVFITSVKDGNKNVWENTEAGLKNIYELHFQEADWFLKADVDSYIVMENLQHMLEGYDPNLPSYFGRESLKDISNFVLSRKALQLLSTRSKDSNTCQGISDGGIGPCLKQLGIKVEDSRDQLGRALFYPCSPFAYNPARNYPQEVFETWSDYAVAFERVNYTDMYTLDVLIYWVKPLKTPYQTLENDENSGTERGELVNSKPPDGVSKLQPVENVSAISKNASLKEF